MMRGQPDSGQYVSDATALIITGVVAALLTTTRTLQLVSSAPHTANDPGIELSVESAPSPLPPAPPPPVPRKLPLHHAIPKPVALAETLPAVQPDPPPSSNEQVPADTSNVVAPAATEGTSPNSHPDVDAQYAAGLRADIDRRTHAPDTPQYRLHRPSGEARVRFVVVRNGDPKAVMLLRSSGSSLLDEAALQIVSSGHYAPMPANAFAGESEHTFVVTIEFRPGGVAS